jgi:hypothetical protein
LLAIDPLLGVSAEVVGGVKKVETGAERVWERVWWVG